MALESLPKIAPALFSAEQDLLEIYNKKSDTRGTINPSYIKSSPSGVSGAIQFSDGSAFSSDASNLYWDNVNKRLGIGTNAPLYTADIAGNLRVTDSSFSLTYTGNSSNGSLINAGTYPSFKVTNAAGTTRAILGNDGPSGYLTLQENGTTYTYLTGTSTGNAGYSYFLSQLGVGTATTLGAKLSIKGSGSTSATTSLLVQNSAGNNALQIQDNFNAVFGSTATRTLTIRPEDTSGVYGNSCSIRGGNGNGRLDFYSASNITAIQDNTIVLKGISAQIIMAGDITSTLTSGNFIINSTTNGFLMPRMTTAEINAIASPANGLQAYNTTLACPCFYDGVAWRKVSHTTM